MWRDPSGRVYFYFFAFSQSQSASEVVALQEVAPLQHFDVALVDFERRAQSDGEAGQHVATLHEQQRLAVDLLWGRMRDAALGMTLQVS